MRGKYGQFVQIFCANCKNSIALKIRQMAEKCIVLMNLIIIILVCGVNEMPSLINLKTSKPNVAELKKTIS